MIQQPDFGTQSPAPVKNSSPPPADGTLSDKILQSSLTTSLQYVEGLVHATSFDVKDFVLRYAQMKTDHAVQLVIWAVPLYALRIKFKMTCAVFQMLKKEVVDQQFESSSHGCTTALARAKKKTSLMAILTAQVTVSELAVTQAYITQEDLKSKPAHFLSPYTPLLSLVVSKFGPGSRVMNMRKWAKQIRIWKKGTDGGDQDSGTQTARLRRAVRAWHAQADTTSPRTPTVAPSRKSKTSKNTDTSKKTTTSISASSSAEDSSSDEYNVPSDSSDTSDSSPRTHKQLPKPSKPHKRQRATTTKPLGERDPPVSIPDPPSGAPLPKTPQARSRLSVPWTLQKKKARVLVLEEAVTPQSTRLEFSHLPYVPVVLLADLQVRKQLMDKSLLLSASLFGASDVCGNDDQFPTAVFREFARNLIASTRDYSRLSNCVPVTGGKVTGQDLSSTLAFHCHFSQAVAIVCVKGGGCVTVKSFIHPATRVGFGKGSEKAGHVVIFPGQHIVLDASAKQATWCLVGMAVTGVSVLRMDPSKIPPTLVEENQRFRMNRLLKLRAPMHPRHAVLLKFDDRGKFLEDPRLPQTTNVMMQSFFFLQAVFLDILSMDQARVLGQDDMMVAQAVERLPSILGDYGILENYDLANSDCLANPQTRNDLEMVFDESHIQAFLGGPWTLVELFCGKFHGYFHARAGSLYVHAVVGGTLVEGDPDRLKVKITSLCKQGDLGAATLCFEL